MACLGGVDTATVSGDGSNVRRQIKLQVLDSESDKKEVAWLGVATEETPDVVSAQLGLTAGDGLVVVFVQPDSPAAKAGLQKNDVLFEFGDQLLVHPGQFRKLVRRQKEGDKVKLSLFRNGKKQTISPTLTKTTERAALRTFNSEISAEATGSFAAKHQGYSDLHAPVAYVYPTKKQLMEGDLKHNLEDARKAIRETLAYNHAFVSALGSDAIAVEALAKNEAEAAGNSTVTVKKDGKTVKTIVKADEAGTYVIVANPRKRLTVRDKDGKLIFDGEIETSEQQEKVPEIARRKAQLMIEEIGVAAPEVKTPEF
jgi:serine protease Do